MTAEAAGARRTPARPAAAREEIESLMQLLVALGIAIGKNAGFRAWRRSRADLDIPYPAVLHEITVAAYALHERGKAGKVRWGSTHDLENCLAAFADLLLDGEIDYEEAADAALYHTKG